MSLERDGYTILNNVIADDGCQRMATEIMAAMNSRVGDAIESERGQLVGGRNLLTLWSGWRSIVDHPVVAALVDAHVGSNAGVVRILYFDKPPGKGWSLSLHKDRTIAVAQHCDSLAPFAKPTRKAGVPHVEASFELLRQMLTLRLHLDAMHQDNGPLMVVPGSHEERSQEEQSHVESECEQIETIHCAAGDLFVMRPLLSHGSRKANPATTDHRRVVHLEIAPCEELPGDYRWYEFKRINASRT